MTQTNKRLNQEHRARIKGLTLELCRASLFGRFVKSTSCLLIASAKRYSKSWTQTGSPKIKQELAGSNRNATVEEMGVLRYMIRRLCTAASVKQIRVMHGGAGEEVEVR